MWNSLWKRKIIKCGRLLANQITNIQGKLAHSYKCLFIYYPSHSDDDSSVIGM
jgi:hypothetical protein